MRLKFTRDRSWTVPTDRRVTIDYKAGRSYTVKRDWGETFVKEGIAKEVAARKSDKQA